MASAIACGSTAYSPRAIARAIASLLMELIPRKRTYLRRAKPGPSGAGPDASAGGGASTGER
jgi:hypothetical protein